jgi:hypothetical protein
MFKPAFLKLPAAFLMFLTFLIIPGFLGDGGPTFAQEDPIPEIGGSPGESADDPNAFADLTILNTHLDLAFQYARFTGEDMRRTYGVLPMVTAGLSFQVARASRLFLSLGYGENSGNPFYDNPGLIAEDQVSVRYVPLQIGMKFDLAKSTRIHVYAGLGLELAWMEETVPLRDQNGDIADVSSSGVNSGYQVTFGPEFVLGQGGQALGMELGWGGSKGSISSPGHEHEIDMTGYRGRVYLALEL